MDNLNMVTRECGMKINVTRGKRKIQMLHDWANVHGYVALKQVAENR